MKTRDTLLRAQHALTDAELAEFVALVVKEQSDDRDGDDGTE